MKRLFFALWPDRKTRSRLSRLVRTLDDRKLRPVRAMNIHVTLVFLGAIEASRVADIECMAGKVSGRPFSIVFDQLLFWRKPKILCLGCSELPPEATALVETLKHMLADMDIETEARPFRAHVTLARKVRARVALDFDPVVWSADRFCLVESITDRDGTHYNIIQSWSLTVR